MAAARMHADTAELSCSTEKSLSCCDNPGSDRRFIIRRSAESSHWIVVCEPWDFPRFNFKLLGLLDRLTTLGKSHGRCCRKTLSRLLCESGS